jgi:DNA-directed RNA polymerase subunit N (RpoN/RPB10)
LLAVLTIILLIPWIASAEVRCVAQWEGNNDGAWKEFYPSGRSPSAGQCKAALVEGTIEKGDYQKLLSLIERSNPFFFQLYLNSPGGDVDEAMRIGRLVRHIMLTVEAPTLGDTRVPLNAQLDENGHFTATVLYNYADFRPNQTPSQICAGDRSSCSCASACVLIWAAGAERQGEALGFHRPTIIGKQFPLMDAETAQKTYAMVLSEMRAYLEEMELPPKAIDLLIDTKSGDIHWLTDDEVNGEILDSGDWEANFPPSIQEWISSSCGTVSKSKYKEFLQQMGLQTPRSGQVIKEFGDIDKCALRKFANHRDSIVQIAPP